MKHTENERARKEEEEKLSRMNAEEKDDDFKITKKKAILNRVIECVVRWRGERRSEPRHVFV